MKPASRQSRMICSVAALGLSFALLQATFTAQPAHAEKYQSRLNSLILKKNNVYMPSRLVLGEEARFVIKAPAGSQVKLFLSAENSGYKLPNGTTLRVGEKSQELTGVVPANGVLQLTMTMPKDPEMDGKTVYVDAVVGQSDDTLEPIELVDANGHRTGNNALAVMKPSDAGSMSIMPNMPGVSPQLLNQLNNLANTQNNPNAKDLMDNGNLNQDRAVDKNPFIYRGYQQGIQMGR